LFIHVACRLLASHCESRAVTFFITMQLAYSAVFDLNFRPTDRTAKWRASIVQTFAVQNVLNGARGLARRTI
jgi:hypothetical protein